MNALAPIADRLGKLLRMLSSDKDGEVVGAARAIVRTLQTAKLDIHELADTVEHPTNGSSFTNHSVDNAYRRGFEDGRRAGDRGSDGPSWHTIASECAARADWLRENERKFVSNMVAWTVRGGEPTEKQAKWLRSIYAKVR